MCCGLDGWLTLLELLEAFECDFELVRGSEGGWVVEDFHPKEGDDGHGDG